MQILIVTPAPRGSRNGNRITAERWARILKELGHQVEVRADYNGEACKLLIALHARRSGRSIERFRRRHPGLPLVVVMTGTDLYHDIERSQLAQRSMQLASRILLLQLEGLSRLPDGLAHKARVIYQSAVPPARRPPPLTRVFEISVIGHLRAVKDPFRAAMAARQLPSSSRIRIVHLGKALLPSMKRRAEREMQLNERYQWLGERPWPETQRRLARSRLMVLSSKMEGSANALSEALAVNVPVLASRISGTIGLLGESYPGYFEVGDTRSLSQLMWRAETDPAFYRQLQDHCAQRAALIRPAREKEDWDNLIGEFLWERVVARE